MRVRFKRQFFGKNGARHRKDRWYDVPDSWADSLPKDAEVDESPPAAAPVVASGEEVGRRQRRKVPVSTFAEADASNE